MIKGYIFDMDGTLIDSMAMICRMDREIFRRLDLVPTEEALEDMRYIPLGESSGYIKSHFDIPLTEAEVMRILMDTMIEGYRTVEMKAGAIDYLEFCKSQGIKMCIATATEPEIATDVAKNMGFLGYMENVTACSEVGCGKTRPDVFIEAARRMGLEPHECVVFEDGIPGATSAGKAGFKVVGVFDPTAGEADSKKMKSITDRYIVSFEDVKDQLI
ncbi:MAG: HAD family phosphatase [Clostridia bacterium]|nr:HAD family phosphatase [Clostridia bacterium]